MRWDTCASHVGLVSARLEVFLHATSSLKGFKEKFCSWDFWCVDFWVVTPLIYFLSSILLKWLVRGSIYKPHWESSRWGRNPAFLLLTGCWNRPDRTRPVVLTVGAAINWSDAASVRSPATWCVRSQFCRSGTSLYSTGLCCPTSGRSAASVRSSIRSRLLSSL